MGSQAGAATPPAQPPRLHGYLRPTCVLHQSKRPGTSEAPVTTGLWASSARPVSRLRPTQWPDPGECCGGTGQTASQLLGVLLGPPHGQGRTPSASLAAPRLGVQTPRPSLPIAGCSVLPVGSGRSARRTPDGTVHMADTLPGPLTIPSLAGKAQSSDGPGPRIRETEARRGQSRPGPPSRPEGSRRGAAGAQGQVSPGRHRGGFGARTGVLRLPGPSSTQLSACFRPSETSGRLPLAPHSIPASWR